MELELISAEERADGSVVRYYIDDDGREIRREFGPDGKEVK